MFLPNRLFILELKRHGCWKEYLHYRSISRKVANNSLRIIFLESCLKSLIIPKFLKFRIPNNGCFDDRSVHEFQLRLLRKEIIKAKSDKSTSYNKLIESRNCLKLKLPDKCRSSVILHMRYDLRLFKNKQSSTLNKKLTNLSSEQDRPLFSIKNTVICYQLDLNPPKYVLDTLSLGPKNSILDRFDQNTVLAELDSFVNFCNEREVPDNLITDINVKTLSYIKKCKKQNTSRNIMLTKKYLKEHNLLAVPFDKGVGICIMKKETYNRKLAAIYNLPQFEKYVPPRKNAKHQILKEEENICTTLVS